MVKKSLSKFVHWVRKAPERKHYVEFITATLSIPVLLTVILVNINNLNQTKVKSVSTTPSPSPLTREIIIREAGTSSNPPSQKNAQTITSPTPTPNPECKKEVGPISIENPTEGQTTTDNPINFIIKYSDKNYCSVVWSYRINGGQWSEYSSNSPAIYNMPSGSIKFELRVQSTVSNDQAMLTRNFVYQGSVTPPVTQAPTPTTPH